MSTEFSTLLATELKVQQQQVQAVVELLDGGATVPFIARYRKEKTQGLDEVAIIAVRDGIARLRDLQKRREAILKSLREQEKLTPELEKKVNEAPTMAVLEDIYLPYKPKKRTRATDAKEKGLEPLAQKLFEQGEGDPLVAAQNFINEDKGVKTADEALAGARDIIAEWVNEDAEVRQAMRQLYIKEAIIASKVAKDKEEAGKKYKDYFDWSEPINRSPSHRLLAMFRGTKEGFLTFKIAPEEDRAISLIEKKVLKGTDKMAEQVKLAIKDCYNRLLSKSMETEIKNDAKERADEKAISVFAENLRELLLASPLGQRRVLAIDPGQRTGCKIVCLDEQGKLLIHDVIYPLPPQKKELDAKERLKKICKKLKIEFIAVGNGTGGRETLSFCRKIDFEKPIPVVMVNESGASVYSASKVAREEFPDHDVTVRGAVSIGRRLMDPLAELVKIDPKSIGVGQYQHDVNQKELRKALDDVVVSCVNAVGVDVNTASKQLLAYVSGLGPKLAGSIVEFRNENGAFPSRVTLKQVAGMGPKGFEQSAGFLRIRGGRVPLDSSAVHPESYHIVKSMAKDLDCSIEELMEKQELRDKIELEKYVTDEVGIPTLTDIVKELAKPGRDPRSEFEVFTFAEGVNEISDLKVGMELPGIVTNVTAFGAFVDVGVHQDGLVHISQLADKRVTDPTEIVKVNQKVKIKVIEVDLERKRLSFSMRENPDAPLPGRRPPRRDSGQRRDGAPRRDNRDKKPRRDGGAPRRDNRDRGKQGGKPGGRPGGKPHHHKDKRRDDDRKRHHKDNRQQKKKRDKRPVVNENPFWEALKDWNPEE